MTYSKFIRLSVLVVTAFTFLSTLSRAQQPQPGGVTVTPHLHDIVSITSRDYWVAFPENYGGSDDGGKYIELFISSVDSTTAYVEVGGQIASLQVVPGIPVIYNVPLQWEMLSSDSVENKAVHVWSDDAALFVDFNSHDAYTSDASYIIPSIGWGGSYVVAAYESLYEGGRGYIYDYPSEFVIIANQDSSFVTITPSVDLRGPDPKDDTTAVHPVGIPFTVMLDQGQVVQYEAVKITNPLNAYDVTGTQIIATNPVGVIGASSCANIPVNFPYCDFACEMLQPTRTWGKTYYTAPLFGRTGGDTYLVIGTELNQTITRTDAGGPSTFATLANINDHVWSHDITTPSSWTSDAPFMLMQYSNSSTWPDKVNGNYDPFMMAVNSVDQFSTPVIFNVLHNAVDQSPYLWHADIVARSGVPVFVDGQPIGTSPIYDDQFCAVYEIGSLSPKQHIASSDSGVSVSVYGDGYDEAVGYSGMIGVSTKGGNDFIAPKVVVTPVSDTRTTLLASDESANMSGLSQFEIDSISNMTLEQSPNFVNGNGSANSSFDLVVVDPSKPAHASVRVVDLAGNYSTVVKNYTPQAAGVTDPATEVPQLSPSPNPANGFITIPYELPEDSHVAIALFDVLGNLELSVLSANETAGDHTVTADVRLLPAGTYIYRINGGGEVHSGRISIVR